MPKDDRFWRMKPLVGQPREPTFEQHCDLVTFASGWFTTKPTDGTIGDLIPNIAISSCDYAQARFMLPLGTVEIDGSRHWIVQWSNPMFETYAILKPTKVGMEQLLEAGGGACPTNRND
jgi:hypothetical protein